MGGISLFRPYGLLSGAWGRLKTGDFALAMGRFPAINSQAGGPGGAATLEDLRGAGGRPPAVLRPQWDSPGKFPALTPNSRVLPGEISRPNAKFPRATHGGFPGGAASRRRIESNSPGNKSDSSLPGGHFQVGFPATRRQFAKLPGLPACPVTEADYRVLEANYGNRS